MKFRKLLEKGAVVTRGLDGCLFVYPAKAWQGFAEKVSKLPISQSDSRAFSRHMLSGAMALEIDKQGRAVLPDYLRQFAGVSKKVVVAGLLTEWKFGTRTNGTNTKIQLKTKAMK